MDEEKSIIDEMDEEILDLTGGEPKEFDLKTMFNESQEKQKNLYGGGEENINERRYLEGLKAREDAVKKKKEKLMKEVDEVEELNELEEDGIFIKK